MTSRIRPATHFTNRIVADLRIDFEPSSRIQFSVIDPLIVVFSTYLGGHSEDTLPSIAADASGAVYNVSISP
jgi:hypothetical protein